MRPQDLGSVVNSAVIYCEPAKILLLLKRRKQSKVTLTFIRTQAFKPALEPLKIPLDWLSLPSPPLDWGALPFTAASVGALEQGWGLAAAAA